MRYKKLSFWKMRISRISFFKMSKNAFSFLKMHKLYILHKKPFVFPWFFVQLFIGIKKLSKTNKKNCFCYLFICFCLKLYILHKKAAFLHEFFVCGIPHHSCRFFMVFCGFLWETAPRHFLNFFVYHKINKKAFFILKFYFFGTF